MKDVILNGDCFDLLKDVPDKSCGLIKLDLPYGTTRNSWDIILPFDKVWENINRVKTENAITILYTAGKFTALATMSNFEEYKYDIIWQKTNPKGHLNAKRQPMRGHENILIFGNPKSIYTPLKTTGHPRKVSSAHHKRNSVKTSNYGEHGLTSYDSTERYPTSVLTFKSDTQKSKIHPTQKPVPLDEWLIKTYSNEGDIVLDFVAGSCTTAIACINTNRHYICMEKIPAMYKKGSNRVNEHLKLWKQHSQ